MQATQNNEPFIFNFLKNYRFPLYLVLVLTMTFALWSVFNISIEVMPKENTPPFLYVHVNSSQSMSPEKQELALTLPLEGAMRTVPNLLSSNTSTNSSGVSLSLNFKPRTDLDLAEVSVQEAMQELDAQGILNLKNVTISRANPEASALIRLAMSSDSASLNELLKIKDELRIALETIPEVSKVEIFGIDPLEVQYSISLNRAEEFGIAGRGLNSFFEVQNVRESVGLLSTSPDIPSTSLSARLVNNDLKRIERQSLKPRTTIGLAQLSVPSILDKGQIEISHKDGKKSVFIEIYNKEGANLFELKSNLKSTLLGFKSNANLSSLLFEEIYDKTKDLKTAITDVVQSLIEALLITFLVVFIFLRHFQQTVLIAIAIPTALLMTVSFLFYRGISLNMLTLSGLILGVGMVVDSTVLVVTRISERLLQGDSRVIASARGAQLSIQPLLMSTLTNSAIFLPVAFLDGGDSFTDILRGFQVPLLATLISALLVSLFFVPIIATFFDLSKVQMKESLEESSRTLFRKGQKYGKWVLGLSVATTYIVTLYISDIQQTDLEQPPEPFSTVNVRFVPEIGKDHRREFFLKLEQLFLEKKEELGYRFMVSDLNPFSAGGTLTLYPQQEGSLEQTLKIQNENLKKFISSLNLKEPGIKVSAGWDFEAGNYSAGSNYDTLRLAGPKTLKLMSITEDLKTKIQDLPGVESVKLENEIEGEKALVFLPYQGMLVQYGLDLMKVSNAITSQMSTLAISGLNYNGQTVGAKIYFSPESKRWDLTQIKKLLIPIEGNRSVSLRQLGEFVPQLLNRSISRKEFIAKFSLSVFYKSSGFGSDINLSRRQVQDLFQSYRFPVGYGPPRSEDQARVIEMQKKSVFILGLSALFIYLLLGAIFESFFVPIAILATVPLALVFGVAGLKILGFDLDVMARLSLVILVGIGINSAIILIDLITELRQQGVRRHDAVVIGSSRRLKSVLMTAGIQILSVLPVALGKSKLMGIPYSSLGISIISGMVFSTIITLGILPVIYEYMDEVQSRLSRRLGLSSESKKNQHQAV